MSGETFLRTLQRVFRVLFEKLNPGYLWGRVLAKIIVLIFLRFYLYLKPFSDKKLNTKIS